MKHLKKIPVILVCGALPLTNSLIGCSSSSVHYVQTETFDMGDYTQKLFKSPKIANKIYIVNIPDVEPYKSQRYHWNLIMQSLQGILAQTEARIFFNEPPGDPLHKWFDRAKNELHFDTQNITPDQALQMFKNEIKDQKLVLYNTGVNAFSIHNATVISSTQKHLMCPNRSDIIQHLENLGFHRGEVAKSLTPEQNFDKYKDQLNNGMLISLKKDADRVRDYAIAAKALPLFIDDYYEKPDFLNKVLFWLKPGSPVLGWTNEEIQYIKTLSSHNLVAIGSDICTNLSFYSAQKLTKNHYQFHKEKIVPRRGEHYVAIVMSDGDNFCWLQNDWEDGDKWFGSKHRGKFPMNWTLNPATIDLLPQLLPKIYSHLTDNDYFVCSHGGYGYCNYSLFSKPNEIITPAAQYMKNCDMSIIYNLEPEGYKTTTNMEPLLDQEQVKGIVWGYGNRYGQARGGVKWHNDKPIVAVKETMWDTNPEDPKWHDCFSPLNVARRINSYSTNPQDISGYTIVNAHSWSYGTMDYIKSMVNALDSHVKVVSMEQLFQMIQENVPHVDMPQASDYPPFYDDKINQ